MFFTVLLLACFFFFGGTLICSPFFLSFFFVAHKRITKISAPECMKLSFHITIFFFLFFTLQLTTTLKEITFFLGNKLESVNGSTKERFYVLSRCFCVLIYIIISFSAVHFFFGAERFLPNEGQVAAAAMF